jgi:hypothetical protein
LNISQINRYGADNFSREQVLSRRGRVAPLYCPTTLTPPMPSRLRNTLRHAFAVEPPGPAVPSPEERAALDPLIAEIRRRGLVTPAVFFLESVEPLNNVGAQALHFMQPFATAVLDPVRYAVLVKYLERRGSITWVAQELQREPVA